MKILIDNIINASRIENKGMSTDKTNIDMRVVLKDIVRNHEKRHNIKAIHLEADESAIVFVDVFMIETSINNVDFGK